MGQRRRSMTTRLRWTVVDLVLWAAALFVAASLRLDFHIPMQYERGLVISAVAVAALQVLIGWLWGPYAVSHELGSFEETGELARTTLVAGAALGVAVVALDVIVLPRSVPVSATVMALTSMFAARFVVQVAHHPPRPCRRGRPPGHRLRCR